jgi:hypothetical protein
VVLSEAVGEYTELANTLVKSGTAFQNRFWVELYNPIQAPQAGKVLQQIDGLGVPLSMPAGATPAYSPYRLTIAYDSAAAGYPAPNADNDNVLGAPPPPPTPPAPLVAPVPYAQTVDADFPANS